MQLCSGEEDKQKDRRRCLKKILRRIRYLLRQGISFRVSKTSDGNLYQLLQVEAEEDPDFAIYLKNNTNFSSWSAEQEFAKDLSHSILRKIARMCPTTGCMGSSWTQRKTRQAMSRYPCV